MKSSSNQTTKLISFLTGSIAYWWLFPNPSEKKYARQNPESFPQISGWNIYPPKNMWAATT